MQQRNIQLNEIAEDITEIGVDLPQYTPADAVTLNQQIAKTNQPTFKLPKTKTVTQLAKQNSRNIKEILQRDDKYASEAKGTPSRLARNFMNVIDIKPDNWFTMLNNYLLRPQSMVAYDARARNTKRGNLNRQTALPNMSYNVFEQLLAVSGVLRTKHVVYFQLAGDAEQDIWRSCSADVDDLPKHVDSMNQLEFCFGDPDEQQETAEGSE
jgi:hypothetical protein